MTSQATNQRTLRLEASRRKRISMASVAEAVVEEMKTHTLRDLTEPGNTAAPSVVLQTTASKDNPLHHLKNEEHLKQLLKTDCDVNAINSDGDAPIHTLLKRGKSPKERREVTNLLMTLLIYSPVDVNLPNCDKMTPLHIAAQNCDLECAKILLVFGAEVNPFNKWGKTPLDLLSVHQRFSFKTVPSSSTDTNTLHPLREAELMRSSSPSKRMFTGSTSRLERAGSNSPTVERAEPLSDKSKPYKTNKRGLFSKGRDAAKLSDPSDKGSPQSFRKRADTFVELSDRERDLCEAVLVSPQEAQLVHEEGIEEDAVPQDYEKLNKLLESVGAYGERTYQQHLREARAELQFDPKLPPFPVFSAERQSKTEDEDVCLKCAPGEDPWVDSIPRRYKELDAYLRKKLADPLETLAYSSDEAFGYALQLRELTLLKKSGSRILCLDGGGMKGLIQIEVLEQIEKLTQRKITEIFDWIVGTSVGGIVALVIVYAKKTLRELRQLMFQMKDEVFGSSRGGYGCNTEALEKILNEVFGDMKMDEVKYPRVMVTAVNKSTTDLKLHFFNNCFETWFGEESLKLKKMEVWKVARYTSAGPLYFEECDNYVDGGILANNPCMEGLTKIQDYYRQLNQKLPISLVVSVGCGIYPPSALGSIDAQKFLFFGRHWLPTSEGPGVQDTVKNLATLMSSAITESETSAKHCENCCEEQGVHYFRFSPSLDRVVAPSETNSEVLFEMIISTRLQSKRQGIYKLIRQLHELSKCCRKMHRRFNCAPKF